MTLRSKAFWHLDRLRGSEVKAALRDVQLLSNPNNEELRARELHTHLEFVTLSVPYYRDLRGTSDLSAFPVVSKRTILQDPSRFIALGADITTAHVASSSGSTGEPFRVFHDAQRRRRADAESVYFGRAAGYEIGQRLYHLRIWTTKNHRGRIDNFARNLHPIDVRAFGEEEAVRFLQLVAATKGSVAIIAYSSALETLARVMHSGVAPDLSPNKISSIVGQSEPLSAEARHMIHSHLGVYPVARYGTEELGIIAQQTQTSSESYRLASAGRVTEILKLHSDEPASPGEVGRIVVSDLVNRAQPLIRYDTQDLGVLEERTQAGEGMWLKRIEGRSVDQIYDVNDKPLAPMIASAFWWKYPEIYQYQVVQVDKATYVLRISAPGSFDRDDSIVDDFRNQVGGAAKVTVEHTTSNFTHRSGKRRPIVGLYTPEKLG